MFYMYIYIYVYIYIYRERERDREREREMCLCIDGPACMSLSILRYTSQRQNNILKFEWK